MSRVSIASLRLSNPGIEVTVACDAVSAQALKSSCDPLLSEVDEVLSCETPPGDAGYRNRHVKTRLREIIEGPFLFLDSDTLFRGDLCPIFGLDADVAGAANHSSDQFGKQLFSWDVENITSLGWAFGEHVYLNGGVLYYNDTPASYLFSSLWHKKWLESLEYSGIHRDQPALNAALFEVQPRLIVLPHKFNTQVKVAPQIASDAIVWHYYASCFGTPITSFEVLISRVLNGERLRPESVAEMIRLPHPWRRESWLDDWAANRVARIGRLTPGFNLWFQGHRSRACYYWVVNPAKQALAALRWRMKLRTRLKAILRRTALTGP